VPGAVVLARVFLVGLQKTRDDFGRGFHHGLQRRFLDVVDVVAQILQDIGQLPLDAFGPNARIRR
jgi:hypothetical protein